LPEAEEPPAEPPADMPATPAGDGAA
jgi:hypothetical protein